MSHPLLPAKPTKITVDTLPALFAHNRARFGGWAMTTGPAEPDPPADPPAAPERPEGVSETEWTALGDTGKTALTRERDARQAAERALAAARAKPAPPKPKDDKTDPLKLDPKPDDKPDFAALIQQAVDAAVKPFRDAEDQRRTESAAEKIQTAVLDAAKSRLHDATDALAGIDLTSVVNDQGLADAAKIKTALDDLVIRKPHLAKAAERLAPPGIGGGAPTNVTDAEKVKAVLADMQRATGVRTPSSSNTTN